LDELLSRHTPPEERREVLARMRDTLVHAKMGLDDLRTGLAKSRQRLDHEQRELETVQRRKRLAEGISDVETVRLAVQYETLHAEKVAVLKHKMEAQENELAIAEREVADMMKELRNASIAPGLAGAAHRSAVDQAAEELEAELSGGRGQEGGGVRGGRGDAEGGGLRDEIDSLSRTRARAEREADAARKLEELKRRMGK
jgi:hypothetical protein